MNAKRFIILLIITVGLFSIVSGVSLFILDKEVPKSETEVEFIQGELEVVTDLYSIWEEIEGIHISWVGEEMNREEVAVKGMDLYNNFMAIKNNQEVVSTEDTELLMLFSNSLRLKTEVMLFDMLRGFEIEGNPYADREQLDDETLDYVIPKRKVAFEEDMNYILEKFSK